MLQTEKMVGALYVDVSDATDDGKEIWEELQKLPQGTKAPVIAVCKEGNMAQMRYALMEGQVQDILFAPLEAESLQRRVRYWLTQKSQ